MREYSFLNTILYVNGIEINGFDEGDDLITLERLNDSASHVVGGDGEMSVSISADRSGSVTFRLMQTSQSNGYLSGLIKLQESFTLTPIAVFFKDTRGNEIGLGTYGYITKPASMSRGSKASSQEWVIIVERLDLLHFGASQL